MLLARRLGLRSIRSLPYLIVSLACVLLLIVCLPASTTSSSTSSSSSGTRPAPKKTTHKSTPTYEHASPYRLLADHSFEQSLDEQLATLEAHVGKGGTKANQTVWQIAERDEADIWEEWRLQWHKGDPDWGYELYTTSEAASILSLYSSIPEITNAYVRFPAMRTDLLRYLILWYHGGLFAEVDTWARVAMEYCSPIVEVTTGQRDISLMVGVEIDEPYLNAATKAIWKWSRSFGLGQAVVWAPKRFDPVLRRAIVRAIAHMKMQNEMQRRRGWKRFFGKKINMGEVTGPSMFTDCVLDVLSETLVELHPMRDREAGLARRVTWKQFRKLEEPVWVEPSGAQEGKSTEMRGLAVLPINIWASGQRHSRSGSFDTDEACVDHVYGRVPLGFKKGLISRIFGW